MQARTGVLVLRIGGPDVTDEGTGHAQRGRALQVEAHTGLVIEHGHEVDEFGVLPSVPDVLPVFRVQ